MRVVRGFVVVSSCISSRSYIQTRIYTHICVVYNVKRTNVRIYTKENDEMRVILLGNRLTAWPINYMVCHMRYLNSLYG